MTRLIEYFDKFFRDNLLRLHLSDEAAAYLGNILLFLSALLVCVIIYYILKYFAIRIIKKIARKTASKWDDIMIDKKVFQRFTFLVPALILYGLAPPILADITNLGPIVQILIKIYIVFVIMLVISSFLNALHEIYLTYAISKIKPIKGYIQVVKIIMYIIVAVLVIAIFFNSSPWPLLTGMGAISAILLLIFKDTILGLVASIQLSTLDLVRPGDWIEMPKYSVDGTVMDINLTTVKVRNWDMTITTVPTYALIAESFQNWRGMEESGGRRIKRSVKINLHSVKFCTPEMLEKFSKIHLIRTYIEEKEKALKEYNSSHNIDNSVLVNGRRQTNLGVFRAYMIEYLKQNPKVNADMTLMVRQLQSTETGIPLEIYVFSHNKAWVKFEELQADIFDHILAIVPQFDLEVFQNRTIQDPKGVFQPIGG
ncbi:MAG: mechanosensitive ion channel family protein [Bacteroidales bacterium]|nr:mechanosensitive ion channel family protein [Bacteroidales bacterium]MDZ4203175.1 mechanosensitive ion channel family protein [Bacteroidales bacterium]